MRSYRACALVLLTTLAATMTPAMSAPTNWIDGNGDWFAAGNWDNGVPTAGQIANILNGSTVDLTGAAEVGTLNIAGGSTVVMRTASRFSAGATINLGSAGNAGTLSVLSPPFFTAIDNFISGAGGVTINGFVEFNRDNTYSGPTTITTRSVLEVGNFHNSGSLGTGDVIDNGNLVFVRTGTVVFGGAIQGTGHVTVNADYTTRLILTGTNTYTGGTGIGGSFHLPGHLQVGDGGTTGSIVGDVVGQGTLAFDRSDTLTYSGSTNGISVAQLGSGTLILTGYYAPDIHSCCVRGLVSAGTLQLGDGGTTGQIFGDIDDDSHLVVDRSDTSVLLGTVFPGSEPPVVNFGIVFGSGDFVKKGVGALFVLGVNTYTGPTTIEAGTMFVDGSIANSAVTVESGTTLAGHGTVGSTIVESGSTLSPGHPVGSGFPCCEIGTLHVAGDLTLASGSLYLVEAGDRDGFGAMVDQTVVSGAASLAGRLTLTDTGGPIGAGKYALITSTGPMSGAFSALMAPHALGGLDISLAYDAHDVFLVLDHNGVRWSGQPVSGDWNTGADWLVGTVPAGTDKAFFGPSTVTSVDIRQPTAIAGMNFAADAPGYAFNIAGTAAGSAALTIGGSGIGDASSNKPTFIVSGAGGNTGTLTITDTSSSDAVLMANAGGTIAFTGGADGAESRAVIAAGGTLSIAGLSDGGMSIGSIEGTGSILLGANTLSIGGLGTSTQFGGTVSGSGGLTKAGAGTLILTGTSDYTGGTTIAQGAIQIGDGGTSGSVMGDVADDGALVFDRSDAVNFTGVISGTGGVMQIGAGATTLSRANTYSGNTDIEAGTLVVNGSIASSSQTTVHSGATLTGAGTVGALTVADGGTLAPGDGGVGTLHAGATTLAPGSTLAFEATAAQSDLLSVGGAAGLGGTLSVVTSGTGYSADQRINVVTAPGGVSGTFLSFVVDGSFGASVKPVLAYDATSAFILLKPIEITPLLPQDSTPIQRDVAAAIDIAIRNDNAGAAFDPLFHLNGSDLKTALDQLSGELGTGLADGAFAAQGSFLQLLLDPFAGGGGGTQSLADADHPVRVAYNGPADRLVLGGSGGSFSVWGGAQGDWSNRAATLIGTHSTNISNGVLALGLDYRADGGDTVAGAAIGIGQTLWSVHPGLGRGNANAQQLGLYAAKRFDAFYVSMAAAIAQFQATTMRSVALGGTNIYRAHFDGQGEGAQVEAGWRFEDGDLTFTPFVLFRAEHFQTPAYGETTIVGIPNFALGYLRMSDDDVNHELGLQLDDIGFDGGAALRARLGWVHDYSGGISRAASFAGLPGTSFVVRGAAEPEDAAHVSLGTDSGLGDGLRVAVQAQALLSAEVQDYGASGTLAYHW